MSTEPPGYPYGPSVGGPAPVPPQSNPGNTLSIVSFVLAAISVLFFPIIFGPIAIVLAGIAISRKEPLSRIAIGVAIACMIVGFILGAIVYSANN